MFEYAKDHGYIVTNPFPELRITVKFRQVSKPSSDTQVYNTDEYQQIIEDLWKSYNKKHEARFLSIVCNFWWACVPENCVRFDGEIWT